jgi:hypothetical protein
MPNIQIIRKQIAEVTTIAVKEKRADSGCEIVSSPILKLMTPMDSNSPDLKLAFNLNMTSPTESADPGS